MVFPGSRRKSTSHLQPKKAQFAQKPRISGHKAPYRSISSVFNLLSPGLKSDILGENYLQIAATFRFIAYLSQSRNNDYIALNRPLQEFMSKKV